jgi:hypothetical protein
MRTGMTEVVLSLNLKNKLDFLRRRLRKKRRKDRKKRKHL